MTSPATTDPRPATLHSHPTDGEMNSRRIIWTCWFQGREHAPELIRKCLQSWEERNPDWDFRVLDAEAISRYIDLQRHVDLTRQSITAASLSDILRALLLHEYGGVWVDATTYCNVPLDDWLPLAGNTGFFAFARPGEGRPLATWFLAAAPGNPLLAKWAARTIRYWLGRERTNDYFWFHHQFGELCATDKEARQAWQNVPRISADGPHSIQRAGMYEDFGTARSKVDWTTPVFKLTYRLDAKRLTTNCLIVRLLGLSEKETPPPTTAERNSADMTRPIGKLKVGTENLGDHVQIIAAEGLLRRQGSCHRFWLIVTTSLLIRPQ